MIRSLKYQMVMNLRSIGFIALILLAFIPYAWIVTGSWESNAADYYIGMCFGVLLMMSFILPFSNAATLARIALGYGATRKGWFWGSVVTKIVSQALSCAIVLFVATPLGAVVFQTEGGAVSAITRGLRWAPLLLCLCLAFAAIAEALGYVMSRFSGKVLILVILIAVGIVVVVAIMLVVLLGAEWLLASVSVPVVIIAALALFAGFQIVGWRLVRNLSAA